LKPFKVEEIHAALGKYKRLQQAFGQRKEVEPIQFSEASEQNYQGHFLSQHREKTIVIKAEEVALFSVENETVYLYTLRGERHPVFKKLEYLEDVCDPHQFFRVNRQMLVSRKAVTGFEPYFNRKVVLSLSIKLEEQVIVSRLKVTAFKEWLEK
ncbi:MAG: LytTR family DNA-binding domain-containing protein, partial [Bacteroidota bacterium]